MAAKKKDTTTSVEEWLESTIPGIGNRKLVDIDPQQDLMSMNEIQIYQQALAKAIRTIQIKLADAYVSQADAYRDYKNRLNELIYDMDKTSISIGKYTNTNEDGTIMKFTDKSREATARNMVDHLIEIKEVQDRWTWDKRVKMLEEAKSCLINLSSRTDSVYNAASADMKKK